MKFFVSGATSGLGRNATEWLLANQHQVHGCGRDAMAGIELQHAGAQFSRIDLTQATPHQLNTVLADCDAIWHCAAKSSPWGDYASFYQANVSVTERLAQRAGELGIPHFIHISTPSIYFDFQHRYQVKESFRPQRMVNHYAVTKYLAEQVIQDCVKQYPNTRYIILRPRALFGPHDRVILPRILSQLKDNKKVLRLPAGGKARLDLTFVLNVVDAMWQATNKMDLTSGAVFNITNQQPARLVDLLDKLLRQQLGLDYQVRAVPYRLLYCVAGALELVAKLRGKEPALTRYSVGAVTFDMTLCSQLAISELNYQPPYSLDQAIVLTADWLKAQEKGNG